MNRIFIRKPDRKPDHQDGELQFYYIENLVIHERVGLAAKIEIRDGRVGIIDVEEDWIDLGDFASLDYLAWLLKGGLSLTKRND